jgi:hypothetical protein
MDKAILVRPVASNPAYIWSMFQVLKRKKKAVKVCKRDGSQPGPVKKKP